MSAPAGAAAAASTSSAAAPAADFRIRHRTTDAYQLYRRCDVGVGLLETIDFFLASSEDKFPISLAYKILQQYDHEMAKALAEARQTEREFQFSNSDLLGFTHVDGIFSLALKETKVLALFKQSEVRDFYQMRALLGDKKKKVPKPNNINQELGIVVEKVKRLSIHAYRHPGPKVNVIPKNVNPYVEFFAEVVKPLERPVLYNVPQVVVPAAAAQGNNNNNPICRRMGGKIFDPRDGAKALATTREKAVDDKELSERMMRFKLRAAEEKRRRRVNRKVVTMEGGAEGQSLGGSSRCGVKMARPNKVGSKQQQQQEPLKLRLSPPSSPPPNEEK